jgi:hypothetical protein
VWRWGKLQNALLISGLRSQRSQTTSCHQHRGSSLDLSNANFCPEDVLPLSNAGPRKVSNRGKHRRKAVILTDTSEKRATEEEKTNKKETVQKRTAINTNKNNKRAFCKIVKRRRRRPWCLAGAKRCKTGEDWVQCMKCQLWSHVACSEYDTHYACMVCRNDSDKVLQHVPLCCNLPLERGSLQQLHVFCNVIS